MVCDCGGGVAHQRRICGNTYGRIRDRLGRSLQHLCLLHLGSQLERVLSRDDQLQFRWSGTHNVANATKQEYDNCAKTANVITTHSGDIINFTSSGPQYFICTVGDHCQRGQKLAINVTAGSNPATPQLSPPPPPGSSAPALASVATSSALFAISTIVTSIFIYI